MSAPYREELGDMNKLPAELREQIKTGGPRQGGQRAVILRAIADLGGRASLNELLIALWRADGKVRKRAALQQALKKMTEAGLLWRIGDQSFVYSTADPAAEASKPSRPAPAKAGTAAPRPPLDTANAKRAKKAYEMLTAKVSPNEIATQLGLGFSPEQVETLAEQFAKENGRPWPV